MSDASDKSGATSPELDNKLVTYTVAEVAELLGFHVNTIYRAIRSGALKAANMGGRRGGFRISRLELIAWWESAGGGRLFADTEQHDKDGPDG